MMDGSSDSLSVMGPTLGSSPAVLLTPGRTRNIAQDMEALRLSRQDNPYLQQVMASRESLIESHPEECESDDTILMSQEFGSTALSLVEDDPLTLKEVHEHMIRSPPPTSCWPHDSLTQRAASAFDFGGDGPQLLSSHSVDGQVDQECGRSPRRPRDSSAARARSSSQASPRPRAPTRPLSLPGESHLKLNKKQGGQTSEKFSLLQHPRPLRRRQDDSVRLVADCDK